MAQRVDMPEKSRLSIGIPVFNGEKFLPQVFDCLLRQTFTNFDIIISDNASNDGTAEICREYESCFQRFQYARTDTNIGATRNFNRVYELGTAPYFKWTAHDDLFAPTYLERCVEILDSQADVVVAHSGVSVVDNEGREIEYNRNRQCYIDPVSAVPLSEEPIHIAESSIAGERFADVLHRMFWCTALFGVVRRSALDQTSLHESYYGSDKVLLAELALLGKFSHAKELLFIKRVHAEMSRYKTGKDKSMWIDPSAKLPLHSYRLLRGYTSAAIRAGKLTLPERASCLATVVSKTIRARSLRGWLGGAPNGFLQRPGRT